MLKFKNLSIRHKLTTIIVLISGLMTLIVSLALIINESRTLRRTAERNLLALTDVIAINSTAALSFQDPQTAKELLHSLRVEPHIVAAAIYNADGDHFAGYSKSNDNGKANPLPEQVKLAEFKVKEVNKSGFSGASGNRPELEGLFMNFRRPVVLNHKIIGLVYVRADQGWIYTRMKFFVGLVVGILLGLIILTYFLSRRLQRVISRPVEKLAHSMDLVTIRNDYTVRVQPQSSDELGQLMAGFNDMLEQIQKRDLELERISKMKSEFLANMSHELRTPLNAIIGFSELLMGHYFGDLNENQDGYVKDIHNGGQHLLSLINDILDLSKVEAGKMSLCLSDVDVTEILNSSLTMIREKATKHTINLSVQIDKEMPQVLRADERMLKQVLYNLLSNAAKFSEDGGCITLSAEKVSRNWIKDRVPALFKGDCLALLDESSVSFCRIAVSDTGIGIEPEALRKIFSAFMQVESTSSRKYGGTGLGLALCKNFLELHHGTIWAESVFGQGSTFTMVIPYIH